MRLLITILIFSFFVSCSIDEQTIKKCLDDKIKDFAIKEKLELKNKVQDMVFEKRQTGNPPYDYYNLTRCALSNKIYF